jgi:hypothetical protein
MQVDPKLLEVALARAITDSVSPEDQQKILAQAMHAYLFTKTRESYSGKETDPLSEAFKKALDNATHELVKQFLSEPEQKARILDGVRAAFEAALTTTPVIQDKLTERIVRAFSAW